MIAVYMQEMRKLKFYLEMVFKCLCNNLTITAMKIIGIKKNAFKNTKLKNQIQSTNLTRKSMLTKQKQH